MTRKWAHGFLGRGDIVESIYSALSFASRKDKHHLVNNQL